MIFIEKTKDFEFYSSTSKGAMQGYGYEFHRGKQLLISVSVCVVLLTPAVDGKYGCRLLRLSKVEDFSIHDIALVDGEY